MAGGGYDISSSQTLSNASRGGSFTQGNVSIGAYSEGLSPKLIAVLGVVAVVIVFLLFHKKK